LKLTLGNQNIKEFGPLVWCM